MQRYYAVIGLSLLSLSLFCSNDSRIIRVGDDSYELKTYPVTGVFGNKYSAEYMVKHNDKIVIDRPMIHNVRECQNGQIIGAFVMVSGCTAYKQSKSKADRIGSGVLTFLGAGLFLGSYWYGKRVEKALHESALTADTLAVEVENTPQERIMLAKNRIDSLGNFWHIALNGITSTLFTSNVPSSYTRKKNLEKLIAKEQSIIKQ